MRSLALLVLTATFSDAFIPLSSQYNVGARKLQSSSQNNSNEWSGGAGTRNEGSRTLIPPPPPSASNQSSGRDQKSNNPLQNLAKGLTGGLNNRKADRRSSAQTTYNYRPREPSYQQLDQPHKQRTRGDGRNWWDVGSSTDFAVVPEGRQSGVVGSRSGRYRPPSDYFQGASTGNKWYDLSSGEPLLQGGNEVRGRYSMSDFRTSSARDNDWRYGSGGDDFQNDIDNRGRTYSRQEQYSSRNVKNEDWRYSAYNRRRAPDNGTPIEQNVVQPFRRGPSSSYVPCDEPNSPGDWRFRASSQPLSYGGNVERTSSRVGRPGGFAPPQRVSPRKKDSETKKNGWWWSSKKK